MELTCLFEDNSLARTNTAGTCHNKSNGFQFDSHQKESFEDSTLREWQF